MTTFLVCAVLALGVGAILHGLGTVVECIFPALAGEGSHRPSAPPRATDRPAPCPTLTYLMDSRPGEANLRLERGQTLTVLWPHSLDVVIPAGLHLEILEASSERIRVMAV